MSTTNIEAKFSTELTDHFTDPKAVPKRLHPLIMATKFMVLRRYKEEIPVDKGTARSEVKVTEVGDLFYVVSTTVRNKEGKRYPIWVHEGTMSFKGSDKDYGSYRRAGAIRGRGKSVAFGFDYIDSNSGKKGIRPNKFAKRAYEWAQPQVPNYIRENINKLIK